MRKLLWPAMLAAAALPVSAAQAAPAKSAAPGKRSAVPARAAPGQEMTCPVGGAAFTYKPAPQPASIGMRPDGKPYGSGAIPTPLPECPDNGLVLYKDYSPEEVAKLTPMVDSADYQALRSQSQYYRAYWLMKQMGLGPERYLWALLQAAWEADDRPQMRALYLTELAEESGKAEPRPEDINWIGMEGRAIDALRELGRFDEASARLAKLPLDALRVPEPQGAEGAAARAAQVRRTWLTYFEQLKAAIDRRDASAEPFDMIPRQLALRYCVDWTSALDPHQKAYCEKEHAAVEGVRAAQANTNIDISTIARPRSESGR